MLIYGRTVRIPLQVRVFFWPWMAGVFTAVGVMLLICR